MRECGLKPLVVSLLLRQIMVTPHAGVWIETAIFARQSMLPYVTPHAGVWIETQL